MHDQFPSMLKGLLKYFQSSEDEFYKQNVRRLIDGCEIFCYCLINRFIFIDVLDKRTLSPLLPCIFNIAWSFWSFYARRSFYDSLLLTICYSQSYRKLIDFCCDVNRRKPDDLKFMYSADGLFFM